MNSALQIANYVIHIAWEQGTEITNLHLQKILYYLQAETLVSTGKPLFAESIEKWRLGPVVPEAYHEYKGYGSHPITETADEITFDEETMDVELVKFNEDDIDIQIRDRINPSIIKLLETDPFDLVDKTHNHSLWNDFKDQIEAGKRGLRYTNEEITNYFSQNPERLGEVLGGAN